MKLEQNYQYSADLTIIKLRECLVELKKNKLEKAGPPSPNEELKRELGIFNPDDITVRKVAKPSYCIIENNSLKLISRV